MGHSQPIRGKTQAADPRLAASEIPDKLYFRIGEVARLCAVPAYVLRFWEGEFPQLKPNKGGTGQRLYRRRDVEMALRVKSLLKEEGYTIPGARAVLKAEFKLKEPQFALPGTVVPTSSAKQLRTLRRELQTLATMLAQPIVQSVPARKSTQKAQTNPANHGQSLAGSRGRAHPSMRDPGAPAPASPARTAHSSPPGELIFDDDATRSNSEGDGR